MEAMVEIVYRSCYVAIEFPFGQMSGPTPARHAADARKGDREDKAFHSAAWSGCVELASRDTSASEVHEGELVPALTGK